MLKYIKDNVLEKATDELEADDLSIHIYENEISIQINELYDGPEFTYNAEVDTVKVYFPLGHEPESLDVKEVNQIATMVDIMKYNKELLKELLIR
jgi:hypothetical protein